MYKIAKLTFKPKFENKDKSVELIDDILWMLYQNGQITSAECSIEDYSEYFVATVTTTDDDSLEQKYFNEYIKNSLASFDFKAEIIANAAGFRDSCHCVEHGYYIIDILYGEISSHIICGDCGKEIPLIKIPYLYNEKEHYSLLSFQSVYYSVSNLWQQCLSDRFTKRQLVDTNSQLIKMGIEIRGELEKKTGRPVYLFVEHNLGEALKKKPKYNIEFCPKCKKELRNIENYHANKVCDDCMLAFSSE